MSAIDLTDTFHTPEFMTHFPRAVDRNAVPFKQVVIHHSTEVAGRAYGIPIEGSTRAQEEAAILAMARDHRNRLGVGPGYNYIAFQSGRIYAVGKAGTERRHTTSTIGRTDGKTWNWDSVAICAFGGFDTRQPSRALLAAVEATIEEIKGWSIAEIDRVMAHTDVSTSECPGRNMLPHVRGWHATLASPSGAGVTKQELQAVSALIGQGLSRLAAADAELERLIQEAS